MSNLDWFMFGGGFCVGFAVVFIGGGLLAVAYYADLVSRIRW